MRVLMFGWEFPPLSSGGLGTACYGLTKALHENGIEVTFVVPNGIQSQTSEHMKLIISNNELHEDQQGIIHKRVGVLLQPYINTASYQKLRTTLLNKHDKTMQLYGENLYEEVHRYAAVAEQIAKNNAFDVIHAHDWLTFPAAIRAKQVSGKPLVVQIHATEFDRTADHPNETVYAIEKQGMVRADTIIAVSNFTKQKIIQYYGIDAAKISVVHNAVEQKKNQKIGYTKDNKTPYEKLVLFLGRLTVQKGAIHFLYAAQKVLTIDPNVLFVIAGSGDMETEIINKTAELGIADKVVFTGFVTGNAVDKMYRMADLYVMPSVSEPFGITPLEALRNNTPVLISKQSGVSEVLHHALKVDFWDINLMASKILSVLHYPELYQSLRCNGRTEVQQFHWQYPAEKCLGIYNELVASCN